MEITVDWLKEQAACDDGIEWFKNQTLTDSTDLIRYSINNKIRLDWANWLIVRTMTRHQYLAYAIFAAEQVIDLYEKQYPDDTRPRDAIEAAKRVLENDTSAARDAAWAAWAARDARAVGSARAARAAAVAAGAAAGAAAWSAARDARDAGDDARAAGAAGAAAVAAGAAAGAAMFIRILKYGLSLIEIEVT